MSRSSSTTRRVTGRFIPFLWRDPTRSVARFFVSVSVFSAHVDTCLTQPVVDPDTSRYVRRRSPGFAEPSDKTGAKPGVALRRSGTLSTVEGHSTPCARSNPFAACCWRQQPSPRWALPRPHWPRRLRHPDVRFRPRLPLRPPLLRLPRPRLAGACSVAGQKVPRAHPTRGLLVPGGTWAAPASAASRCRRSSAGAADGPGAGPDGAPPAPPADGRAPPPPLDGRAPPPPPVAGDAVPMPPR